MKGYFHLSLTVLFISLFLNPAFADISCTVKDQIGLQLTIYNDNLGLVKDERHISLPDGRFNLKFMDVASKIIPSTVYIKSLINPSSLAILEQNYEFDLLSPNKLLEKYVGKDVKLYLKNPYTDKEEVKTATLLSNNNGPVFKIGDEITFGHPGRIIFPGVPENLISKPTLFWLLENTSKKVQKLEVSYLTEGLSWQSDYVLVLDKEDTTADITGWVTLNNTSGTTYRDAALKLVAGDVHRVKEKFMYDAGTLAMPEARKPQFREEAFFEYHVYSLKRKTTVKDNQIKQISLLSAGNVPIKKEFVFKGQRYFYTSRQSGFIPRQKVGVYIVFENKKKNNLGISLPKGIVRIYKHDSGGSLQFIGEDSIDHTPKDEKIRIKAGDAFDVVGERKQTDWKKLTKGVYEASYEIILRNHKKKDVSVKVLEPIPGDWTMLSSSHEFKKTEAFTAEFNVKVPRDGETKIIYRIRMKF